MKIQVGALVRRKFSSLFHTGLLAEVVRLDADSYVRVRLLEGPDAGQLLTWNRNYFKLEPTRPPDWEV